MRDHRLNQLGQITAASEEKGSKCRYFFSKGAMRFFSCRVSEMVYPTFGDFGTVFVTSERDSGTSEYHFARYYTVRRAFWAKDSEGIDVLDIETLGEFQQYRSRSGAHAAAKRIQKANMVPRDDA